MRDRFRHVLSYVSETVGAAFAASAFETQRSLTDAVSSLETDAADTVAKDVSFAPFDILQGFLLMSIEV